MAKQYTVDFEKCALTTQLTTLVGNELIIPPNTLYEQVIADLCNCMLEAIKLDDAQGKQAIGHALHMTLTSVINSPDPAEG